MKKALLLAFIITALPTFALCWDQDRAKVPFVVIPGHISGPVLHFDYDRLYNENEYFYKYLTKGGGFTFEGQQVAQWLEGLVGHYMLFHDSWYVYALDSETPQTSESVLTSIKGRIDIDITDNILGGWSTIDASKTVMLGSGRNFYYIPMYANDWIFHLSSNR